MVVEGAADEFAGVEGEYLAPVAVSVVPVAEADLIVLKAHEAVVGDRHAVGIAAEVIEHLLWPAEGRLGVDHPIVRAQRADEALLHSWLGECGGVAGELERAAGPLQSTFTFAALTTFDHFGISLDECAELLWRVGGDVSAFACEAALHVGDLTTFVMPACSFAMISFGAPAGNSTPYQFSAS
jgi:hypothetical protein